MQLKHATCQDNENFDSMIVAQQGRLFHMLRRDHVAYVY